VWNKKRTDALGSADIIYTYFTHIAASRLTCSNWLQKL